VILDNGPDQHLECVVHVDELQPRVAPEHGRHHGQCEVAGQRGVSVGADERREPQHRGQYVGPATAEAAHVPLDLDDVLGESASGHERRRRGLGEDGGVAKRRAVRGGRRPHHQFAQPRRRLTGREELHRTDDVVFLHRLTTSASGAGQHTHVRDHVNAAVGHRADETAQVGGDDVDPITQKFGDRLARSGGVHARYPGDSRIFRELAGQVRAKIPAHAGDQDIHLRLPVGSANVVRRRSIRLRRK
jgi:hypothetical protein